MTIRQSSQTDAFTLQYDDSFSDAERRAVALAGTAEDDLETMRSWFELPDAFGPEDRCVVLVGQPGDGMAVNYGYSHNNSQIVVNPAQGWPADAATQELCDNCCRAMFVMEFIEVMMSLRNHTRGNVTWMPNGSNGEGLSLLAAEVLYPDACYRIGTFGYPRAKSWFTDANRRNLDFVTTTEPTDRNDRSWGCSIAFIYYLLSQLRIPLPRVIQHGGATLEDTYHTLTGLSGGFDAMMSVLDENLPVSAAANLRGDDPFPLDGSDQRSVAFTAVVQELVRNALPVQSVTRTLPFPCQGQMDVEYTQYDVDLAVTITATPVGIANPSFAWTVGGAAVPTTGAALAPLTVSAQVIPNDPRQASPPPLHTPRTVHLQCRQSLPTNAPPPAQLTTSSIELLLPRVGGDLRFEIGCDVTADDREITRGAYEGSFTTRLTVWLDDWALELRGCRERAAKLLAKEFKPIFGPIMPDPPPEWVRSMETLASLLAERDNLAKKGDKKRLETLERVMTDYLHVPAEVLGPYTRSPAVK